MTDYTRLRWDELASISEFVDTVREGIVKLILTKASPVSSALRSALLVCISSQQMSIGRMAMGRK